MISCKQQAQNTNSSKNKSLIPDKVTTYYFIRHAEKDRQDSGNDPRLTPEGKQRASQWAKYFKDKGIDMIFSTAYHRTRETAHPTASEYGLRVRPYKASKLYTKQFQKETAGQTVLVVGHQDTTPDFVNTIFGEEKYEMIPADNHGKLFKVVLKPDGSKEVSEEQVEF